MDKRYYFSRLTNIPMNLLRLLVVLWLGVTLYACSSGGGGDDDKDNNPPPDTHVQGSVVKGIIKNADVDIYAISNGQVGTTPLQTVNTDSNGAYSFTLSPSFSGPVLVVVHDNAQNTATMICDSVGGCADDGSGVAFGGDLPLGDLELKTYVQNVTGGSAQTVSITPLTLMAAALLDVQVVNGGTTYTAQAIAAANSQVGNLLSVNNIVITTPPDITNAVAADADSNSLKYALLSAAITEIAQQDFGGDIVAAVQALVNSFITTGHEGQLLNNEDVDTPEVISLAELLDSAKMTSSTMPIQFTYGGNVTNELSNLQILAENDIDEWTDAQPSPTSGMGELETVKAFVADLRTWGNVINEEVTNNTSALDARLTAADATFAIAEPLLSDAFGYAINAAFESFVRGTNIDLSTYTPDPFLPAATGTATISGNTVTVIGGLASGTDFDVAMEFPASLSGTEFSISISSATVSNTQGEVVVTQPSTVTISYADTYPGGIDLNPWTDPDYTEPFPDPDSGSLDLQVSIDELSVANAVSFEGSLLLGILGSTGGGNTVLRDINGNVVYYNPSSASLSGTLTSGTNSGSINASATMPNADTFMPLDQVYEGLASYSFSNGGDALLIAAEAQNFYRGFEYISDELAVNYQHVVVTEVYPWSFEPWVWDTGLTYPGGMEEFLNSDHYTITGGFWVEDFSIGSYTVPLPQQFADWNPSGGTLDGYLDWGYGPEEGVSNYRQLSDVSLTFNATLDNVPPATFTLSGNRTGLDDGDLELNIAYGSRSIHATGSFTQNSATGTIIITNQDGVVLTVEIDGDAKTGSVKMDQEEYAVIESVNNVDIIRYKDGYFEVL